eukprot:CAMPEP_0197619818 /NCGR_PEP_ID=MMETSP1338-20131121/806_1 /TAXON_ID=43686 ORGANISM="Pelagodinium beii, Strain RCC1491" /NCGR_SAMPLE_ID=MMETSP1338 /ASSEMBLY_ACC=CAM_ASM_000754 /LENGTH=135 /DNA_ID=CAMNT_0043188863 /DNA_START=59 /DNA_END=463 /DNA_ORIENTATION=-
MAQMQDVDIEVPDGCKPGDVITVEVNGQDVDLEIPKGCLPGRTITIQAPVQNGQDTARSNTSEAEVVIPAGLKVGDVFIVEIDGQELELEVPEGCGPGSVLSVPIPRQKNAQLSARSGASEGEAEVVVPDGLKVG